MSPAGVRAVLDERLADAGLEPALRCDSGPAPVRDFLLDRAPSLVASALDDVLAPGASVSRCRLLRTKVKPEHRISAIYDVELAAPRAVTRRIAVTWSSRAASPDRAGAGALEDEARRRGLLAPFRRLRWAGPDLRMQLLVSPLDADFPQLVRLSDPQYVAALLRDVEGGRAVEAGSLRVAPVRYRPGQRHVLRYDSDGGRVVCYAKTYRDDTGARAVAWARQAAAALAGRDGAGRVARPIAYLPADRLALWEGVPGRSLSSAVTGIVRAGSPAVTSPATPPDVLAAVRQVGSTVALLHRGGSTSAPGGATPDPSVAIRGTRRAAEHIRTLVPDAGTVADTWLDDVAQALASSPAATVRPVHGDLKCDNVVLDGGHLHLLDLDRAGMGDPASDLGKMCSDLRWWAVDPSHGTAQSSSASALADELVEAFLDGYGALDGAAARRVRCYEVLFLVKAAARRLPVVDLAWADQVDARLEQARVLWVGRRR